MRTRFRTLLLAGAALLGMSGAALAQVTVNGSPATINGVSQIVWNSLNISTGNPLPVAVVSGGGGGGTGGSGPYYVGQYNSTPPTFTSAQVGYMSLDANGRVILAPSSSVSVSNFPATQAVSAAALPLPTGAATSANQNSTPAGTSATNAQGVQGVTGGVPLPIQGGNAAAVKTDGSATTQPISAAALPLPSGAATAANQASEISQLTAANQRSTLFLEFNQAIGASATVTGPWRDAGASPSPYTKFNYAFVSSQTGTAVVQVSNDGTNSLTNILTVNTLSSTNNVVGTLPLTYRYYRVVVINGSTAGNIAVNTALATN